MTPAELDSSALKSSVAFTGRLACMTRAEAFEVVRQHGGTPSQTVTKRTKLLIVGELGWPLLDDGRPSNKLARARSYSVPVVSERRFLEWTGKFIPDNANKAYSVDQLASLSGLPGEKIQELAQLSLLDERAGRFGFRDLASARQIAKLLADGVRLSEIIRSVTEIRKWLPDIGLGSVRLHSGPCHSLEVEQAGARTDKRGQFMLAVDDCRHNPDDLFASAQAAEQAGDIAEAERLYSVLMKTDPMIRRQPSIWETCSVPVAAMSRPRQHCTRQPGSILHLRRLGTISVTCSTSRGDPRPPSNVCAKAVQAHLTTATQCSILALLLQRKNRIRGGC